MLYYINIYYLDTYWTTKSSTRYIKKQSAYRIIIDKDLYSLRKDPDDPYNSEEL